MAKSAKNHALSIPEIIKQFEANKKYYDILTFDFVIAKIKQDQRFNFNNLTDGI